MGKLKGFYFSLDALTASMVLITLVGVIATYNTTQKTHQKEPIQLDHIETPATQQASNFNKSIKSNKKMLTYIYKQKAGGNTSKAEKMCQNYFNFSKKYSIYYYDADERKK